MNKATKQIVIISIVVATIGLVVYLLRKELTKLIINNASAAPVESNTTSAAAAETPKTNTVKSSKKFDGTKTLKLGSKGDEVWGLQNVLNELMQRKNPYAQLLVVDGNFGKGTEAALKSITGNTSTTYNNILNYLWGIKQ